MTAIKLKEIDLSSKELFILTARLSKSSGPESYHNDQIAAIRESLQAIEKDLSHVGTYVEDEADPLQRQRYKLDMRRLLDDLMTHRILYKQAVIKARKNLEFEQREALLAVIEKTREPALLDQRMNSQSVSNSSASRRITRDENASNAVLQASSDITAELRRTHDLMAEELSKSALSRELLAESSTTIAKLGDEYTSFSTVLNGSKRLLKELESADRADQLYIGGAFIFLALVAAYIIYKRVLARPVKAVIWTGSFMFSALNRNKIIEYKVSQKSISAPMVDVSTTPVSQQGQSTERSELDEVVDIILPGIKDGRDAEAIMRKAQASRHVRQFEQNDDDIVHAEL